jgi:hypothetical protein
MDKGQTSRWDNVLAALYLIAQGNDNPQKVAAETLDHIGEYINPEWLSG